MPHFPAGAPCQFWVPVLSRSQRNLLILSLIPGIVTTIAFWAWWFSPNHVISSPNMVVATLLVGYELTIPAYFYFFVLRMKKVNPFLEPDPIWSVAAVVTKAPSEPWETVKNTLQAMLKQDMSHDTWLADEDPSPEAVEWCRDNNVMISSRRGIPEYHQSDWPRREKCKEGNLAYFYDKYGYERYDFVSQLDADHVPQSNYLRTILRPFHDEKIGYVAAPSICDSNRELSWAARGRLYAEASLHGPLQAGYNQHWAPLCIGSHYAVRTSALKSIGGVGPELAEDHSTSLMMNAAGWKGAFQIDAIAHGEGPRTFIDCITQEFQWSRSLMMILLRWTPKFWEGLSKRHRSQFLFSQLWYPLFASASTVGYTVLLICLAKDNPLININYFQFITFMLCLSVGYSLPALCLSRFGVLRPTYRPLLSWEEPLFTIMRYPWVAWGILNGVFTHVTGRHVTFKVTPKGTSAAAPLPVNALFPYALLTCTLSLSVIYISSLHYAKGYYYLTLLTCFFIVAGMTLVYFLYHQELNLRKRLSLPAFLIALVPSILLFIIALITRLSAGLAGISSSAGLEALKWTTNSNSNTQSIASMNANLHDTYNGSMFDENVLETCTTSPCFGVYDPVDSFPKGSSHIKIVHEFIPWGASYSLQLSKFLGDANQANQVPLVSLEFWPWAVLDLNKISELQYQSIVRSFLQDLASGKYDQHLIYSLKVINDAPQKVVMLRVMHEMEFTKSYPWHSSNPQSFIKAFRRVVNLSRSMGISKIIWVWSPAGNKNAKYYWPGSAYVDMVGLSIYADPGWNWGFAPPGENLPFNTLMEWKYWVKSFGKPIVLAEVGVTGSPQVKKQWILDAEMALPSYPEIVAWVYYNQAQPNIVKLDIGSPDWSLSKNDAKAILSMFAGR